MKRILLALALLWAGPAYADEFLKPVSSFWFPLLVTPATSTVPVGGDTAGGGIGAHLRITCTSDCAVDFGADDFVTASSSPSFLPADTPTLFATDPNYFIFYEGDSAGTIHIDILR